MIAGRPDPAPSAASCETTTRTYLRGGGRRFWGFTFVPALIFRTALFDSELMVDGYRNVVNSYPHFPFIVRLAEREHALFVAPRSLVHRRGQNDTVPSWLSWWSIWTASCDTIQERWLREEAVRQAPDPGVPFVKALMVPVISERLERPGEAAPQLWRMALRRMSASQRAAVFLALPLAYVPQGAYRLAKRVVLRQPSRSSRDATEYDDLRR